MNNVSFPSILAVGHSSKIAGAELCLLDYVSAFGSGSNIFLFEDGPLREAIEKRGKSVIISKSGNSFASIKKDKSMLRAIPHMSGLISIVNEIVMISREHDIIYALSQKAFVTAAIASSVTRCPLIWHLQDILSPAHFGATQRRLVVRLANWRASCVIACSNVAADAFVQAGGDKSRVRVVSNGVNIDYKIEPSLVVRRELQLPEGFLIGVFSRLSPWKGQHVVLEALASLPEHVSCIIVGAALFGEDTYANSLRDMATQLGIEHRVKFLGHRDDVARLMTAVDVMVHPSTEAEPFGRTLVEAMLCRIPVIAANNGAASEILEDGRCGVLIPSGDVGELIRALKGLIAGEYASEQILRRAEYRAKEYYNAPQMTNGIRVALNDVWQQRAHSKL